MSVKKKIVVVLAAVVDVLVVSGFVAVATGSWFAGVATACLLDLAVAPRAYALLGRV